MIRAVFLASGRSKRFGGGNKLLYAPDGTPLAERAFRALPEDIPGIVVTCWPEVKVLAGNHPNLAILDNDGPDDIAATIRRGVEALPADTAGALFFVCDQPHLTRESVERLLAAFRAEPGYIHVLSHGGRSGNPCLFPRECFPELRALPPDRGGKELVRRHPERVRYIEAADPRELEDLDRL